VSESVPIGVGVIGLGFMGRTHVEAYRAADSAGLQNRLVAVCDASAERRAGIASNAGNLGGATRERLFDPREVAAFERVEDLLADPRVELVSICTPTDTHVELALAALAAKKHVLLEKPVALASKDVQRVADAARSAGRVCMPAMCMRFWPGWEWLRARIREGTFGAVKSAVFQRLGTRPGWSGGFYEDERRSGGALFDLHVHDADFVRWCFGPPRSVASAGSPDHVTTHYRFESGPPHVIAEGGWDHTAGFPFRMRFVVVFEQATADFDLSRTPTLLLARNGASDPVAIATGAGYEGEVRHMLDAIARGTPLVATIDEAVGLTRMLEAERSSLASGAAVAISG
jgi:predicted dehydrogenase